MLAYNFFRPVTNRVWHLAATPIQRFLTLALLTASAVFGSAIANAGGLQVSPVSLALSQAERAGIFTVSNTGEAPMNAQVRVFKWTQTDKEEYALEPTNDLIVSPPIIQLAPGVPQEVRLIRRQAPSTDEQHYRLIIDQLPSAEKPGVKPKKGITVLIRHNIPVFLNSTDQPVAQLQWRAQANGIDKTRFTIINPSKNRAQIARVWLERADVTTTVLSAGLTAYALPGSTIVREFNIPLTQIQAAGTVLKAQINGTDTNIQLGD